MPQLTSLDLPAGSQATTITAVGIMVLEGVERLYHGGQTVEMGEMGAMLITMGIPEGYLPVVVISHAVGAAVVAAGAVAVQAQAAIVTTQVITDSRVGMGLMEIPDPLAHQARQGRLGYGLSPEVRGVQAGRGSMDGAVEAAVVVVVRRILSATGEVRELVVGAGVLAVKEAPAVPAAGAAAAPSASISIKMAADNSWIVNSTRRMRERVAQVG